MSEKFFEKKKTGNEEGPQLLLPKDRAFFFSPLSSMLYTVVVVYYELFKREIIVRRFVRSFNGICVQKSRLTCVFR